jgi:hypothetical protein
MLHALPASAFLIFIIVLVFLEENKF